MTTKWLKELQSLYGAGIAHAFMLHFNVKDSIVRPGVALKQYLAQALAQKEVVVFYDAANGFSFPLPTMKKRFMDVVGLSAAGETSGTLARMAQSANIELPKKPLAAIPLIDKLLRTQPVENDQGQQGYAVIISNAEALLPNGDLTTLMLTEETRTSLITAGNWGNDLSIAATGNMVILVTEVLNDIHPSVRTASSKYEAIAVDLPDHTERLAFAEMMKAQLSDQGSFEWLMTPQEFAAATAALTLLGIEDVFLRARQLGKLTRDLVVERKKQITAAEFAEVIEIVDPSFGWEGIGGLAHIKKFFETRVVQAIQQGRNQRVPMGVLMVGPPGTGKSVVAQAVAKESGINFVNLNLAKIFDKFVGNSERNLERALQAIRSLEPCIVFIDEIDQSVSRSGGGDSGVSARIFKRLLEFMSDTSNRGKVIFLAATNRPDLIDPALMRPGRIDIIIPFFAPDGDERELIFRVMAGKYGMGLNESPITAAVTATEGWTGAEIEAAVVKALNIMEDEGVSPEDALVDAVRRLYPSTRDIHYFEMLALQHINDVDMVPDRMRELLKNKDQVAREVDDYSGADSFRGRGPRTL